ncbi:unnamed protein product [Prunus armeniaca]
MFPKFFTQSGIDWSMKLDNSASYEVRSEMEWLMYCTLLDIGIHSKSEKSLLSPCYDAPQVLDIIQHGLVHETRQFRFLQSSFFNGVVGVLHSFSNWIALKTHQMTPPTTL